jgi:thiol:disulfide interchange protein
VHRRDTAPRPPLGLADPAADGYAVPVTFSFRHLLLCAALPGSLSVLPASAAPTGASKHVQVRLASESAAAQPGAPLHLALQFKMDRGWHTYWRNHGDIGKAISVAWTLPEGLTAGPVEWPYPTTIRAAGMTSYAFEGEATLLVDVAVGPQVKPGRDVTIAAQLRWVECEQVCIPAKAAVDLVLPVRADAPAPNADATALFADARRKLPADGASWKPEMIGAGPALALLLQPPAPLRSAEFFAAEPGVVKASGAQTLRRTAAGYSLELVREDAAAALESVAGVLRATTDAGEVALQIGAPVRRADALPPGEPVAPAASQAAAGGGDPLGLPVAMALAFVGGLILNLMPCVLPVLSLKVLGFVRHAGGGRPWRNGLAFTAGVVLSFLALAGALIALRAGGQQIGWGFQLQSPRFVAGLAVLFFGIGLNLFGVFEVGASLTRAGGAAAGRSGLTASFLDGALATIVATPCTAPFMGSALGFALAQPAYVALLIFTALGLGMATPYLVLSMAPALLRFVPKPGAWMESFKQLMGFLMMGTVVALCWIFGRQTDMDAVAFLLAGLVVVALGAWLYGRAAVSPSPRRTLKLAFAGAWAVAGLALILTHARPRGGEGILWQPFSAEAVAAARAAGKPVFIDFTAAWCFSCQVNERVALQPAAVVERFQQHGIAAFKADLTLEDERVSAALEAYGRNSVPLYVLYAPGASEPQLLPVVLTPDIVMDALDRTLGANASAY